VPIADVDILVLIIVYRPNGCPRPRAESPRPVRSDS